MGIRKDNPDGSARITFRWLGYSPRAAISELFDFVTSFAKYSRWDLWIDQYFRYAREICEAKSGNFRWRYPGAMYHVLNRGDQREDIFRDDHDRKRFLSTLGEACQKTGWQVHAYCLMRNHFHLVIETRKVKKLELVNPQGFAGRAKGCLRG